MKLEQTYSSPSVFIIGLICITVTSFMLLTSIQKKTLQTDWKATFAEEGEIFTTGQATDIHFFLEDEYGQEMETATVTAVFDRIETVHQIEKKFHRIQGGLYETEVVFSVPGTWVVMLDVHKGGNYYKNQFLLTVNGPIIAAGNRDPGDQFHIDQPLPVELQRELDHIPVLKGD